MTSVQPLWQPSSERSAATQISDFRRILEAEWSVRLPDYAALHAFSINQPDNFWRSLWKYAEIIGDWDGEVVIENRDSIADARWFHGAKLNFAENLLRRNDDHDALIFRSEIGERHTITFANLRLAVGQMQTVLRGFGVKPGDVVAGYLSNVPETVIAMLGATSLGAVWTCVAPDLSATAANERLGQLEPAILVTSDATRYNGAVHPHLQKVQELTSNLTSLRAVLVVPYVDKKPNISGVPHAHDWTSAISGAEPAEPIFERFPFGQPLFILYTSGTTGRPKCIVHGAGGVLILSLKEQILHADIRPGDRILRPTSPGWVIWNWMTGVLARGASLILYDGSPLYPKTDTLFDIVESERVTFFGPPAKLLDIYAKTNIQAKRTHDLSALRTIVSSGSLVGAASYIYVYRSIKEDVYFASGSGGTEIFGTFVNGDPAGPVWAGEMAVATLGMNIEILDDEGRALERGPGELVCASPFPTVPIAFRNNPDYQRLLDSYFSTYAGKWRHGDWIERTVHGGYVIHGRSDTTLNARGVRIGTAEIYRPLETLAEVEDCAAVTQECEGGDLRIVLFVQLRNGNSFDDRIEERIREAIRTKASPRHVPDKIIAVPDLPRNNLGKVLELAIRETIHGRTPRNLGSISNPESLRYFEKLQSLRF